jgi:sugar transferase (PEP-CTERM/EpsH1 system associated)
MVWTGKVHPPLVAHVIHRLAVGGLENGLVNLINHMPAERYRHAIICLSDFTDFRERIQSSDVPVIALHKRQGKDLGIHAVLWKVLRNLQPAILHTRNLPAMEYAASAMLAGVPRRVHGEHGRDIYDLDGLNPRYNLLRKTMRPFIHRHIAVSKDLESWLIRTVGVPPNRVAQIYNGVDAGRFRPRAAARRNLGAAGFCSQETLVLGTVGRMEDVKDPLTLVRAFIRLLEVDPKARQLARLVMIGDGSLKKDAEGLLATAGAAHLAWLPGERDDVPEIIRNLDIFVLPSLREGISNTILEAMASGLPVVATRVGGNVELVEEGTTGTLVPPADPIALSEAIHGYLLDRDRLSRHGEAGRRRVDERFSIKSMVEGYLALYDAVLQHREHRNSRAAAKVGTAVENSPTL